MPFVYLYAANMIPPPRPAPAPPPRRSRAAPSPAKPKPAPKRKARTRQAGRPTAATLARRAARAARRAKRAARAACRTLRGGVAKPRRRIYSTRLLRAIEAAGPTLGALYQATAASDARVCLSFGEPMDIATPAPGPPAPAPPALLRATPVHALPAPLIAAAAAARAARAAAAARERAAAARGVLAWHAAASAAHAARREAARRERLAALSKNDYGAYCELLRTEAVSGRISLLISRTDAFLSGMARQLAALAAGGAGGAGGAAVAQPRALLAVLRPYQLAGLAWLRGLRDAGLNGILADEMGLGKTVQVIALLVHLREAGLPSGPALLVLPASVLPQWASELAKWCVRL